MDWQRPPPPYFEGARYKKKRPRSKQPHKFFGPKQVFSPWRGLPRPPPLFQGCPMQQKRVTGAKECTWTSFGSLSPPKCHIFRQKSAKINFGMSLLHKIIGATEPIYWCALCNSFIRLVLVRVSNHRHACIHLFEQGTNTCPVPQTRCLLHQRNEFIRMWMYMLYRCNLLGFCSNDGQEGVCLC